jgi:hypothetical protein
MADNYVDANIVAGKKSSALAAGVGAETVTMAQTVAVLAADADGDIYRVFANVPSSLVPIKIEINNTAVTGGTDYDLGLYKPNGGAVVDKDILADGISMATARTVATSNNAGLTTIAIADGFETLGELSAQTDVDAAYDIALTANTVGSADGTIRVVATFAYK